MEVCEQLVGGGGARGLGAEDGGGGRGGAGQQVRELVHAAFEELAHHAEPEGTGQLRAVDRALRAG